MARTTLNAAVLAGVMLTGMAQSPAPDALGRARLAYNAGKFDDAIAAATDALKTASQANVAAVVLGRAHLERFSRTQNSTDLDDARMALRQVVPDKLPARERIEYFVGLGESLYLDGCGGCFSGAAELFAVALSRADAGSDRESIFEWWAIALDRQAQFSQDERVVIYRRILEGAVAELAKDDRSASATYWLMAAARGTGDLERAWGAAIAGWARSRGFGPRGDALRADLDRFVRQVLLPERAKQEIPDADARPALAGLVEQWEEIKRKYS